MYLLLFCTLEIAVYLVACTALGSLLCIEGRTSANIKPRASPLCCSHACNEVRIIHHCNS